MGQELESYFSLTPDQRDFIRKILNRAFGISFMDVQDSERMELHIISARNGIICKLADDGMHLDDISDLIFQPVDYIERVLTKYREDKERREWEIKMGKPGTSSNDDGGW